jgi:hypothetical protein
MQVTSVRQVPWKQHLLGALSLAYLLASVYLLSHIGNPVQSINSAVDRFLGHLLGTNGNLAPQEVK